MMQSLLLNIITSKKISFRNSSINVFAYLAARVEDK